MTMTSSTLTLLEWRSSLRRSRSTARFASSSAFASALPALALTTRQQPLTHPFTLARSVCNNQLGTEGWCAIFAALRDNKDNKIESWDLSHQGINAEIAKVLAEYVSVSTAITSLK